MLEMWGGDTASVNEKHYEPRGGLQWATGAVHVKTRFIMAGECWPDKLNHDAIAPTLKILERLGLPPIMLISDGLKECEARLDEALSASPRFATHRVADFSINGRHANNKGTSAAAGNRNGQEACARVQLRRPGVAGAGGGMPPKYIVPRVRRSRVVLRCMSAYKYNILF